MATHWLPKTKGILSQNRRIPRIGLYQDHEGTPLVAKVKERNALTGCEEAIKLLGGWDPLQISGKTVLVKPNFNSPHPYPGTTDPVLLIWLIDCLRSAGAAKVIVGESSGAPWWPTRKVLEKLGIPQLVDKTGADLVIFEEEDKWVTVKTGGSFFPEVILPQVAFAADLVIYLSLMKVHRYARLSGGLKLAVGLLHPAQRKYLHLSQLERKIVDLNRAFLPDLFIADCRETFVTEGPTTGVKVEPETVFISANPVALDCEGITLLQSYQGVNLLNRSPRELPTIEYAISVGLGPLSGRYEVVAPGGQRILRSLK